MQYNETGPKDPGASSRPLRKMGAKIYVIGRNADVCELTIVLSRRHNITESDFTMLPAQVPRLANAIRSDRGSGTALYITTFVFFVIHFARCDYSWHKT